MTLEIQGQGVVLALEELLAQVHDEEVLARVVLRSRNWDRGLCRGAGGGDLGEEGRRGVRGVVGGMVGVMKGRD